MSGGNTVGVPRFGVWVRNVTRALADAPRDDDPFDHPCRDSFRAAIRQYARGWGSARGGRYPGGWVARIPRARCCCSAIRCSADCLLLTAGRLLVAARFARPPQGPSSVTLQPQPVQGSPHQTRTRAGCQGIWAFCSFWSLLGGQLRPCLVSVWYSPRRLV